MAILNLRGVDDGIYRKAKVAAFESGQTLTAWVTEALAMRLDGPKFEAGKLVKIDPATFGSGIIPVVMVTREELEAGNGVGQGIVGGGAGPRSKRPAVERGEPQANGLNANGPNGVVRETSSSDARVQASAPEPRVSKGKKLTAEQYFALPYSEQARAVREGRY